MIWWVNYKVGETEVKTFEEDHFIWVDCRSSHFDLTLIKDKTTALSCPIKSYCLKPKSCLAMKIQSAKCCMAVSGEYKVTGFTKTFLIIRTCGQIL